MRKRLQEFALSLHSEKTRLIEFGRFAAKNRERRGLGKPETFTFLGFTFICSKTRRGKFQIKRKSDVSWNEVWNGTEQRRYWRIEDGKLFVETASIPSPNYPGKMAIGRLIFEREK